MTSMPLDDTEVIICLGTGGVGKTTTAASIAYAAARGGRRVCVVTIDPAKRLADAMGTSELSNDPKKVETPENLGLWAVMLDPDSTFDELVLRFATSKEQVARILSNPIYRNLTENLSGTQEYMAMEKLHELASDPRFDLLVVDTPPARNAIEFLNAPSRLIGFLENRMFRLLVSPNQTIFRPVTIATRLLLKTISRVVGSQVVNDAVEFFQAFEGMEEGFRRRAAEVQELLSKPSTRFVLVTGTHKETIDEGLYFASQLEKFDLVIDKIVSNRVTPKFADGDSTESDPSLRYLNGLRAAELAQLARLHTIVPRESHILIPLLSHDITSLPEIDEIGTIIMDPASTYPG